MPITNVSVLRKDLFNSIDTVIEYIVRITVSTKKGNAVIISEEEFKRVCREDGYEDGIYDKSIETAENLLRMNVLTLEQIAQATSLPLEKVRELSEESCIKA